MIYVVDQNYFRAVELKVLVLSEPRAKFVIPDIALVEMCKGEHWRDTMQTSLRTLAQCPTRVYHSMAVWEALNFELKNIKSVEYRLLPIEFRAFVRSILKDIKNKTSENGVAAVAKGILAAQDDMRQKELDYTQNERSLKARTEIIAQVLNGRPLKELKNQQATDVERLALIRRIAVDLLHSHLKGMGVSDNKIRVFLRTKPLLLRYFYLSVRHAVDWATQGGLTTYPAGKVTNDVLDQDYVAIASFFDVLLSKESRVLAADQDLRQLLRSDG